MTTHLTICLQFSHQKARDDDPVVDNQDEENKEENASDEQDTSRSSSLDKESSSDHDDESKEDGKVADVTTEDGHQRSLKTVKQNMREADIAENS